MITEALQAIDEYLADSPLYEEPERRARVVVVRDQMDALRRELDPVPSEERQEARGGPAARCARRRLLVDSRRLRQPARSDIGSGWVAAGPLECWWPLGDARSG